MIRTGRIPGRRTDPAVALLDQIFDGQILRDPEAHEPAHLAVEQLGQSLGKTIGEGLDDDGGVVVAFVAEGLGIFLDLVPGGDGEGTEVVGASAREGGDEVGETLEGGAGLHFLLLLAEEVEGAQDLGAGVVGVEGDVFSGGGGGPDAPDGAGVDAIVRDEILEDALGVSEELRRFLAVGLVGEDLGEDSAQFPKFLGTG